MKKINLVKLNILSCILILVLVSNSFADDLFEKYGPDMANQSNKSATAEELAMVVSDLAFNDAVGSNQLTTGDINAIKQIVVMPQTENKNVASPVSSPTAQATITPTSPVSNPFNTTATNVAMANAAAISIANNINLNNFTVKNTTSAKIQTPQAPTYALINANTRHIYAVKDQNTKYNPSGLTNLMTAYIATQYLKMDSLLTVNRTAVKGIDKDASIAALDVGDTITLKDAIASMFIKGAVDSANVIAENVSGSVSEFVNLMNTTALSFGLKNTIFSDPSGIGNNQSTALEMAIIMAKVCENPELVNLLSLYEYVLPASTRRDKLRIFSKNTQLNKENSTYNADITASRMGYTSKSKYCIASMMDYYNNHIIVVVLKASGSQFSDTKKILEFGKIATTEDVSK